VLNDCILIIRRYNGAIINDKEMCAMASGRSISDDFLCNSTFEEIERQKMAHVNEIARLNKENREDLPFRNYFVVTFFL
jgi:hypothetical protein